MQQTPNKNLAQKAEYSQEILNIVKHWAGNNPQNQDLFAKADASVGSADAPAQNGQVQQQQTVQKGSSSSDKSSSSDGSSSDGSSSSDSSTSTSSGSTSTSSDSTSTGESLSSLLSSVLTTLSDMKSSVSGSSPSSSSDSSSGSSSSDKTSTDKAASSDGSSSSDGKFPFSSASSKTSTDKAMSSDASDATDGSSDSQDEATKALSLALLNFLKTKKQPPTGQFPENGTQHAGAPKGGSDNVNGSAQEPDYNQEAKAKHPMPKGDTGSSDNVNGSAQEPDYNSMAEGHASSSMGKSLANKDQFVKSVDQLTVLMSKIADKVEAVEGKVDSLPNTRKGYAMTKNFTQEEQAEIAKSQDAFKSMEAKILADPKTTWKDIHKFRTSEGNILPTGYSMPK